MNEPRVPDSVSLEYPSIQILEIRNKYTNETVSYDSITYENTHHMYASKKDLKVWCMKMDGQHLSKHKPYLITYLCSHCQTKVQVGITQFLRKIQRASVPRCRYCVNQDDTKCLEHSKLLKGQPCTRDWQIPVEESPKLTPTELQCLYEKAFYQELDSDEQQSYFSYHLTVDEYNRLKSRIVSLYQGRISGEAFQQLVYVPIWKCSNQMKYSCRFYDPVNDMIEKPSQIQCSCETCDRIFTIKHLHSLKNKLKVLCQECALCRHTFKKRPLMNIVNERVLVQSNLETKFVKWCQEHDIRVINGPKLMYQWNGSEHTYNVDFELPELKWIIEIKDTHIWHQQQTQNGKWDAKKNCATQQVSNGTYHRFLTIFPKNWMRMMALILAKQTEKI